MDNTIGQKLKELRKQKRLTLKEVSNKTNLSISFLSQVERSKSSTTLESLKKISEVLGVNPSYFFNQKDNNSSVIKRNVLNSNKESTTTQFVYNDLSGEIDNPLFHPILVTLEPGDNKGNPFSHYGQEFLYILEGTLTIIIDQEEYQLNQGDCIHFDAGKRHYWFNRTDSTIKFLCISASPN